MIGMNGKGPPIIVLHTIVSNIDRSGRGGLNLIMYSLKCQYYKTALFLLESPYIASKKLFNFMNNRPAPGTFIK